MIPKGIKARICYGMYALPPPFCFSMKDGDDLCFESCFQVRSDYVEKLWIELVAFSMREFKDSDFSTRQKRTTRIAVFDLTDTTSITLTMFNNGRYPKVYFEFERH